jgi:hypothetical protein
LRSNPIDAPPSAVYPLPLRRVYIRAADHYITATSVERNRMRAEIAKAVEEIQQAIGLLRRHL